MKIKLFFIFLFFLTLGINTAHSETKIAYIDMEFIFNKINSYIRTTISTNLASYLLIIPNFSSNIIKKICTIQCIII